MTKYNAPQDVLKALHEVGNKMVQARQAIAQLALNLDIQQYPEMAASLAILDDGITGSTLAVHNHIGRYEPVEPAVVDMYDQPDSEDSLLRAFDDMDIFDPSKAPARSPAIAELRRQEIDRRKR